MYSDYKIWFLKCIFQIPDLTLSCPLALGDSAPNPRSRPGATSSKLTGRGGGGVQGPWVSTPLDPPFSSSSSSVSELRKENLDLCSFSSISMRESRLLCWAKGTLSLVVSGAGEPERVGEVCTAGEWDWSSVPRAVVTAGLMFSLISWARNSVGGRELAAKVSAVGSSR